MTVQKPLIFYVESFIFQSKIHERCGTFLRGRSNSLKRTYVDWGTCKTNRDEQGERRSKNATFERSYFLNDSVYGEWANNLTLERFDLRQWCLCFNAELSHIPLSLLFNSVEHVFVS